MSEWIEFDYKNPPGDGLKLAPTRLYLGYYDTWTEWLTADEATEREKENEQAPDGIIAYCFEPDGILSEGWCWWVEGRTANASSYEAAREAIEARFK